MKKLMTVITFLCLMGLVGSALAQAGSLPEDARFDAPVPLVTQDGGESLRSMVEALALSVGLTPIVDKVPDAAVYYGIVDPKPFRQVWGILIADNDLDYALLDNDIMVVGTPATVADFVNKNRPQQTIAATSDTPAVEAVMLRFYRVNNDPVKVAEIVQQAVPSVDVSGVEGVEVISVRGTQAQQDEVTRVLGQFDTAVEQEPLEQRVYQLSYADAAEIATVLEASGINQETTNAGAAAGEGGAAAGGGPDFKVVANTSTNSIVITATEAVQARIAKIIPQLDIAQQQINVQVRIQEISTRAAEDLGIDLKAGLGNFATSILDGGLSFVFDAQRALSGLNIGAVLDTLEQQNLSRRVDDSSMTVLNNQPGVIQSGGTIYISISGSGEGGKIERTIEYGVKIDVTPRITSDGRISMQVSAEVSQPDTDFTQAELLIVSKNVVSSTVTIQPGQTVLLGGLFQNAFTSEVKRIPILGNIPFIGSAFGTTSNTEENTELLLVVNANIIE